MIVTEGQTIDNLWNAIGPLQKRLAVQRRIRAGMDEADAIKEVDELAYVEFEILRPVEDLTRGVSPTRANMNIVAHPEGLAIEDQMDDFLRAVGLIDDQTSLYVKNLTQREARYLASMAQEFRVTHFARYMEKMGVLFDGRTLPVVCTNSRSSTTTPIGQLSHSICTTELKYLVIASKKYCKSAISLD